MPELPEVETVRRGLQPLVEGAVIRKVMLRREDLRFPFPPGFRRRLAGRRIDALARRAKYLLFHLDSGEVLVSHLGMSGSFRISGQEGPGAFHHPRSKAAAHDHVVFELADSDGAPRRLTYNDPRRFGFMLLVPQDGLAGIFAGLGVEPTGNSLDGGLIRDRLAGRKAPLKSVLMDQRFIAGLGNIYVCEALWLAGLDPRLPAGAIATGSDEADLLCDRLAGAIRKVIADAIAAGGSTLRDFMQADGRPGYFQHAFQVYDREGEPCRRPGCGGVISRLVQSGRSTFFCPACQERRDPLP